MYSCHITKEIELELNIFWQAFLLLVTGIYCMYHAMKWKDTNESRHAFWFGIMLMCTIINLKPFI